MLLDLGNSGFQLVAFRGFPVYIQEHAENHDRKCSRAECLHKSCLGLFSAAASAEFRLTGCFGVHFFQKGCFHEMAVFSCHLEAPGKPYDLKDITRGLKP